MTKHSGSLQGDDSASHGSSSRTEKEIRRSVRRVVITTRQVTPAEASKLLGVPWKKVEQLKKLMRENDEAESRELAESQD